MSALDSELPEIDSEGIDLVAAVEAAVREANHRLRELREEAGVLAAEAPATRAPSLKGMGTTLTAMLWDGTRFAMAHVGDSRAYLLRGGVLYQITHDHTLVQSLVDEGRLTLEQAAAHARRSMLLRALESSGNVEPDLSLREARADDRYLLCSDGLTCVLGPEELYQAMTTINDLDTLVRRLIEMANQAGGPDNITCVVADVVPAAEGAEPGAPIMVGAPNDLSARPE